MPKVPTLALVNFCRMVRVGLEAGLPIPHIFQRQAERGPRAIRSLAGRVAEQLAAGETLVDALEPEKGSLPPLFIALTTVGEETGHLSDSFRELEEYFDLQYTLRRNFRGQMILPIFQFVFAVFVICLMLLVMGWLNITTNVFGLGVGPWAALRFLAIVATGVGVLYALYWGASRQLRFLAPVERLVLKLPVLGPALEAVLMSRFCLGLRFTTGAGLPVPQAVRHSLDATASALYKQSYQKAQPGLRRGEELTEVLTTCRVFPPEFLDVIANAEESGQIPEVMERQGKYYHEEAGRRLKNLAQAAGWIIYGMVAVFIIYLIFKGYSGYLGMLQV